MKGFGTAYDRKNLADNGQAVIDFLNEADSSNVFSLPPDMYFYILYHTDQNVLFHQNPKLEAEQYFPVPIEPLPAIVEKFDVDLILVDTERVQTDQFDFEPFETVFENDGYVILQTNHR